MGAYSIYTHLKDAESNAAKLYSMMATQIAHKYPDIAQLLRRLAEEEIVHERAVEMNKTLFMEASDLFFEQESAEKNLLELLEKITSAGHYFKEHWNTLQPPHILQIIVNIEFEMENKHHTCFVDTNDDGLKKLILALKGSDHAHVVMLKEFLEKYKPSTFPIED